MAEIFFLKVLSMDQTSTHKKVTDTWKTNTHTKKFTRIIEQRNSFKMAYTKLVECMTMIYHSKTEKRRDLRKLRWKLWYGKFVQLDYFCSNRFSLPEFNANLICLGTNSNACTHTQLVKPSVCGGFEKSWSKKNWRRWWWWGVSCLLSHELVVELLWCVRQWLNF